MVLPFFAAIIASTSSRDGFSVTYIVNRIRKLVLEDFIILNPAFRASWKGNAYHHYKIKVIKPSNVIREIKHIKLQ